MIDGASPAGYVTPGVVPVGAGPEQAQARSLSAHKPALAGLSDAVKDVYNDVVAVGFDPLTNTWPSPQDNLVDFPPASAANYLALQYAAPGAADVAGLPGRPQALASNLDGAAPSLGGA
jgi:hypothetical protein